FRNEFGMTVCNELFDQGLFKKYCHAELVSASSLNTVHRFRNKFGMTVCNELFGQGRPKSIVMLNLFQHLHWI
ncbi:MAG TPA: hypothetical protein DCM57_07335, partial [Treponema sp.]|nr:hypothetical protein [Treponema sp.]